MPRPRPAIDPQASVAVEWLALQMADIADEAARRDRDSAARLAADICGRGTPTTPTWPSAIGRRRRHSSPRSPSVTRAALAGHPGWLAEEIDRRGGTPYGARDALS